MKSTSSRERFANCSDIQSRDFMAIEKKRSGFFHCLKIFPLGFIFTILLSLSTISQTSDFNQAENDNGAPGSHTIDWINGILNATHTDYFEGHSVPQRHIFTGLGAGQHTLKIKFLTKKDVQHAYDFLTSWQQAFDAAAYYGNGAVNELGRLFTDQCRSNSSVSAQGQAACAGLVGSAFVLSPVISDVMGNGPFPASANVDGKIQIYENSAKGATGFGQRTVEIRGNKAISNGSITFTGYDGDYATYSIAWTNSSANTNILIRYAGHLAMGAGAGGYGSGLGAGSVSGGPYHFKFENLFNAAGGTIFSGSQDNQIMSNAIQIPPTCTLEEGKSGCPETTGFTFNYSSSNAANASLKFYFISNSANAKMGTIAGTGTCGSNFFQATADASGNYTLSVSPGTGGFTAGGSFRIAVCASTSDGTATCGQTTPTTIDNASMVARVNNTPTSIGSPFDVNANLANPTATLTALATLNGSQNNALFTNFSWTVASGVLLNQAVAANLAGANTATATFTPTLKNPGPGYEPGLYAFDVTAESVPNGCDVTARVYINVSRGASCPSDITGPTPVCPGATGLVYSSQSLASNVNFPEPGLTYTWSIDPVGAATITSSAVNVSQVTVTAGTVNFGVRVTVTNANNEVFFNSGCQFNVVVNTNVALTSLSNETKCPGENASFTSTASGTGATGADIRWYKVAGAVETPIVAGVSAVGQVSTLTLTAVSSSDGGTYRAKIGGAPLCGSDSEDGTLTVKDNVALTSLTNASKCPGETATFSSTASGTGATGADIRWYKVDGVVETQIVSGVSAVGQVSTLTLSNVSSTDAGTYRAKIGGAPLCGNDSKDGALTVKDNVALTSLTNVSKCPGETATFSSTASGTNATGADIRWYKVVGAVETQIVSGISAVGQGSTLTISNISASDVATYRAKIGGAPLCGNDSKDATLTLANCAHIFPTQTTCCHYIGGNPSDFQLLNVCTTVSAGKISNAIPGVFFYYGDYTATSTGAVSLLVKQTRNTAGNILRPFDPQNSNNVRLYVDNCLSTSPTIQLGTGGNAGNVTINFNAVSGKKYVISVKYDSKSIIGSNAPAGTAVYTFEIWKSGALVGGTSGQLNVIANCSDNTPAPTGVCPTNLISSARANADGNLESPKEGADISISAFPNPYNNAVNFSFVSPKSGKAVLEVFDLLGRKLAVVYQGSVTANTPVNAKYNVPALNRVSLIYKLSVDKESVLGKVFPEKK